MPALDPGFGLLIVAATAVLLVTASLQKWRDMARFTAVLRAYRLLPEALAVYVARLVPMLELIIGLLILLPAARRAAALGGAALLLIYASAIAVNLLRGRRDLDCGCGGPGERRRIAPWMVVRNGVLACALGGAAAPWVPRVLVWTDMLTVVAGVVTLALLYVAMERLLTQAAPFAAPLGGES